MATVVLHKLNLSSYQLQQLRAEERYTLALVGHVFNELMTLQKLIRLCQPPQSAHPFALDAGVSQALFLLKLLVAKTHEAMTELNRNSTRQILVEQYFELVPGLVDEWARAQDMLAKMNWTRSIRNSRSFHYMKPGQWAPFLDDAACEGAYAIVGETYGNTLFYWSEALAALATFDQVDRDNPIAGLAKMLEEIGELLSLVTSCLARGALNYMHTNLIGDDSLEEPVELEAPKLSELAVPYFFSK